MLLSKMGRCCLTRQTGFYKPLLKAYCDKKNSKPIAVDIDNTDEIDAFEAEVNTDNYNNFFYSFHNQQAPLSNGIDIGNTEAIDRYETLFADSYRQHQVNTVINEEIKSIHVEESLDIISKVNSGDDSPVKTVHKQFKKNVKAEGRIFVGENIMSKMIQRKSKIDILTIAEVAGILGAKKTSELVPHYFNNTVHKVEIDIDFDIDTYDVVVTTTVEGDTDCRTKALTGCSIALITIFNHCIDDNKSIHVKNIRFTD